jgi:signal transduction histidine kinase
MQGIVLFDEKRKPIKMIGVAQDITEQKLFAEELAKQVDERTKALKQANDNLERSNAELEQFAYVASHDLQEPLRKIHLFTNLLLDKFQLVEEARAYLDKVAQSSKRMTGLINDLLDYSRITSGTVRYEIVDLEKVMQNVVVDFELLINQKNAIVKSKNLPSIHAVPLQINQLFFNLVGNALKFSKRGIQPVIHIEATKLSADQKKLYSQLHADRDYYQISFTDNGIGFNQEYANQIFTIFQRLNEKSSYGGYGIGLALCKKIVDSHRGIIFAEGQVQLGAVFTVILPHHQN